MATKNEMSIVSYGNLPKDLVLNGLVVEKKIITRASESAPKVEQTLRIRFDVNILTLVELAAGAEIVSYQAGIRRMGDDDGTKFMRDNPTYTHKAGESLGSGVNRAISKAVASGDLNALAAIEAQIAEAKAKMARSEGVK